MIEASPIDPFNQVLANPPVQLSRARIDSGTYVATGDTVTVVSAAPSQGAGKYVVAGTAPNYTDGALTPLVAPPSSGTNPVTVMVPSLSPAAGASTGSVRSHHHARDAGQVQPGTALGLARGGARGEGASD